MISKAVLLHRKKLAARRRAAIQMLEKGYPQAEIARQFGVSRAAVSLWVAAYRRGGWENLEPSQGQPGCPQKLSHSQERRLYKLLCNGPQANGYIVRGWSSALIAKLVYREWGVSYSSSGILYMMQKNGWSHMLYNPGKRRHASPVRL